MAQHEEIVLWLDRRGKKAIEKHLKGETLQEHLETVLDELCNQLPQREYERISREIYAEDAANREAEEAARTYAAYHVMENGQEWYYKTTPGEELLGAARMLRKYLKDTERSTGKFISLYSQAQPITPEEYQHLMHLRMENTGKVTGVFDLNFDKHLTLDSVASHVYVSPSYLSTLFKKETGVNFSEYVTNVRMENAKRLLDDAKYTIAQISEMVGYKDVKHFSSVFQKYYQVSPAQYRK